METAYRKKNRELRCELAQMRSAITALQCQYIYGHICIVGSYCCIVFGQHCLIILK